MQGIWDTEQNQPLNSGSVRSAWSTCFPTRASLLPRGFARCRCRGQRGEAWSPQPGGLRPAPGKGRGQERCVAGLATCFKHFAPQINTETLCLSFMISKFKIFVKAVRTKRPLFGFVFLEPPRPPAWDGKCSA